MIVNDLQAAKTSLNENSAAGPIDDSQIIQSNSARDQERQQDDQLPSQNVTATELRQ